MLHNKPTPPNATATMMGPIYSWDVPWREFRSQWARWLVDVGDPDPIYNLPIEAIDVLEKSYGHVIIDSSSAKAERHLSEICRKAKAIGFFQDEAVIYPPLSPAPSQSGLNKLLDLYPAPARQQCLELLKKLDDLTPRQAGYVGYLRTEPAYLTEVSDLAQQWNQIPENERPTFPLHRAVPCPRIPEGATVVGISSSSVQFALKLQAFLDRWGLMSLVTWDLPLPQGPLMPNPLPAGAPANPSHGVQFTVPMHFPLQGNDDILGEIRRQQQQLAQERGLHPSAAGLPHHAAYGQILQVIHLFQIISQRYGKGKPRGFVTHVEEAIAASVDCSVDNIKKLRKAISLCTRGKRESVSWLRAPVR